MFYKILYINDRELEGFSKNFQRNVQSNFYLISWYTGCPVRVLRSLNCKDGRLDVMWITLLRTLTSHPVYTQGI